MRDATVSAAGMRIVKLLVGNPPATVSDLIRATGVTRTAITEQLNELVAGGFVDRTVERLPGRGRPRHLYATTPAALLLLFASNQRLVVPAMWRAIHEIGGSELTRKVLKRVTHAVVAYYQPRITGRTPEERLRQFTDVLNGEGHVVEVSEDERGQLVFCKRSCGFVSMFEENRTVCGLDLSMISAIVDAPVRQITCRHDGAPCCTFEVASHNGK